MPTEFEALLQEVRACRLCEADLPAGPRPVVQLHPRARVLLIGQAPGKRVHETGIPWDDPSGDRLRDWLDVSRATFYNAGQIAILPMGFCYPGKGRGGDLPPRPECAPLWHARLLRQMPDIGLTLLIGRHAQGHYLGKRAQPTLTATVRQFAAYLPAYLPLPHPSPRNFRWWRQNPWFEAEVLPVLRDRIAGLGIRKEAGK